MARIYPFQPYRYTPKAGPMENLVTQPYDKISPSMRTRYLSLSPYNLVRVILGEKSDADSDADNVYTRASAFLNKWIETGILQREVSPSLYAYYQRFNDPDTGQTMERKGFIGLGPVEEYSAGIVYRHEQTLTGPKKDRLDLLRNTRAHFGQLFMLYADRELTVDKILGQVTAGEPIVSFTDEYGALNRVWKISAASTLSRIPEAMSDKKLLIADGHHRYETALAYRKENPELKDAEKVMMTFVNMHSPGLEILATHRVLTGVAGFNAEVFPAKVPGRRLKSIDELKELFRVPAPDKVRIGIAVRSGGIHLLERDRATGDLDVKILHEHLLGELLGIGEDAVREQKHIEYVRGIDPAYAKVRDGSAEIAFLLEPTTIKQVSDVAFSGGVMPQKSTDFYPKLLSGLTIYKLEK